MGLKPHFCESEKEARYIAKKGTLSNLWPVFLSESNTTGEKDLEEFYTQDETINLDRFIDVGIVSNSNVVSKEELEKFFVTIDQIRDQSAWDRQQVIKAVGKVLPSFKHIERNKFLDQKM